MMKQQWSRKMEEVVKTTTSISRAHIFELAGKSQGRFWKPIIVFEQPDKTVPQHRFSHGDIVLISRTRPWEKNLRRHCSERRPTRIRIVVKDKPKDLRKGRWNSIKGQIESPMTECRGVDKFSFDRIFQRPH